jgi:hypothetical protein
MFRFTDIAGKPANPGNFPPFQFPEHRYFIKKESLKMLLKKDPGITVADKFLEFIRLKAWESKV